MTATSQVHEACKSGHAASALVLVRAGASLESVRLSQTKGPEVRSLVQNAIRAAGKNPDEPEPVGYARKQAKSNAFFGPRRTPISCKIKKQLLQSKRLERARNTSEDENPGRAVGDGGDHVEEEEEGGERSVHDAHFEPPAESYSETVRKIKAHKASRRSARARRATDAAGGADEPSSEPLSAANSSANGTSLEGASEEAMGARDEGRWRLLEMEALEQGCGRGEEGDEENEGVGDGEERVGREEREEETETNTQSEESEDEPCLLGLSIEDGHKSIEDENKRRREEQQRLSRKASAARTVPISCSAVPAERALAYDIAY